MKLHLGTYIKKKAQGEEVHKETIGLIWVMTSTLRTGKYL